LSEHNLRRAGKELATDGTAWQVKMLEKPQSTGSLSLGHRIHRSSILVVSGGGRERKTMRLRFPLGRHPPPIT
jgi:hypothetical protein